MPASDLESHHLFNDADEIKTCSHITGKAVNADEWTGDTLFVSYNLPTKVDSNLRCFLFCIFVYLCTQRVAAFGLIFH